MRARAAWAAISIFGALVGGVLNSAAVIVVGFSKAVPFIASSVICEAKAANELVAEKGQYIATAL
jgi:hypothetical protein